jgi:hypothetical protein
MTNSGESDTEEIKNRTQKSEFWKESNGENFWRKASQNVDTKGKNRLRNWLVTSNGCYRRSSEEVGGTKNTNDRK